MLLSIANSIQCIGLPIIVTSSKPHLNFLVDTSSNQSVIFDFVFDGLPEFFAYVDEVGNIFGIEGNKVEARRAKAAITFGDTLSETTFSIMEANKAVDNLKKENGFQLHGILGTDFLVKNKWHIDFDKLQIIIPDE